MIGCMIVGGLVALGIARLARHRWRSRGWCCGGPGHGRFGDPSQGGWGGWGGWGAAPHDHGDWGDDTGPRDHGSHHGWFGRSRWGNPLGYAGGGHFILGAVLRRLETTPTQNDALRTAVKEFRASAKVAKGEAGRTRADLAAALRRSSIDAEAMGEMFARHDGAMDSVRKAFVGLTLNVHGILDDVQRERLAQLLERGPRGFRGPGSATW